MKTQLINDIKLCLDKRPRDHKILFPLLQQLFAEDNTNWLANIELTDYFVSREDWAQALPAARATFALNCKNRRAVALLARSLVATENSFEALQVLTAVINNSATESSTESDLNNLNPATALATLFKSLASESQVWTENYTLVETLRDALLCHIKTNSLDHSTLRAIASIVPDSNLQLTETVRFLQLQSIIIDSNELLKSWLAGRADSLSTESLFIVYLLLVRLGDFPERFKEFLPGQAEIAELVLQNTVDKGRSKAASYSLQPSNGGRIKKLLFVLGSMPQADWFLRTGAHYKVIVDYAHYLTKIDHDIKIDVLITNEISDENPKIQFGRWPVCHDAGVYARGMEQHYADWDKDRIRFLHVEKGLCAVPTKQCSSTRLGVPSHQDYFDRAMRKFESSNPDAIVWFGGVLESVVFPHILADRYPSVFRQFNTNNMPRGHFDVGMTYSEKVIDRVPGRWIKFDTAYSDLPTSTPLPIDLLETLGSSTNIITVANNLSARIDHDFANMIVNTLAARHDVKWVLVGITDIAEFNKKYPNLQELVDTARIVCRGFIEYLGELLDQCHVFVYPKVGGGAGGMALAALRGIPVLCFAGGDADALFDLNDMVADYRTMELKLEKLLDNSHYRESSGELYRYKFGEAKFESEAKRLLNACVQAASAWHENEQALQIAT